MRMAVTVAEVGNGDGLPPGICSAAFLSPSDVGFLKAGRTSRPARLEPLGLLDGLPVFGQEVGQPSLSEVSRRRVEGSGVVSDCASELSGV